MKGIHVYERAEKVLDEYICSDDMNTGGLDADTVSTLEAQIRRQAKDLLLAILSNGIDVWFKCEYESLDNVDAKNALTLDVSLEYVDGPIFSINLRDAIMESMELINQNGESECTEAARAMFADSLRNLADDIEPESLCSADCICKQ